MYLVYNLLLYIPIITMQELLHLTLQKCDNKHTYLAPSRRAREGTEAVANWLKRDSP